MTALLRFNAVGIAGFAVQLAVLGTLTACGVPVPVAAILAVEAAVLHNFAWHERWTWPGPAGGRGRRLARFHASNGIVSIAGGAAVTTALVREGVPLFVAHTAAALACALLNFAAAQLFVFRSGPPHSLNSSSAG